MLTPAATVPTPTSLTSFTALLTPAQKPHSGVGVRKLIEQEHELELHFDQQLIAQAQPALLRGERVTIDLPVGNLDRTVGVTLSHEVSKAHGAKGLPDDTITINLTGSAGQSLGAWLASGVTIRLSGDTNDYVGKGLSGGRVIVRPPEGSPFEAQDNIIAGNVALYGATSGELYLRGVAAERFCVRNSGAVAVVEGVGDHGCEYMTGGRCVVLGETGRNFAAGMSGGIAYVYDPDAKFAQRCNTAMVELETVDDPDDVQELVLLLTNHAEFTGSTVAQDILHRWNDARRAFVKVMPVDYKRVLQQLKRTEATRDNAEATEVGHG